MDQKTKMCDGCRVSVPIAELRYMPKEKDSTILLCSSCRAKIKKDDKKEAKEEKKMQPLPELDYICIRCNYKFKHSPSSIKDLRCPYCSKSDKIMKDKVDINRWLEEA